MRRQAGCAPSGSLSNRLGSTGLWPPGLPLCRPRLGWLPSVGRARAGAPSARTLPLPSPGHLPRRRIVHTAPVGISKYKSLLALCNDLYIVLFCCVSGRLVVMMTP